MTGLELLDADRAVLRMVLAEIGATKRHLALDDKGHGLPDQVWFDQAVEDEQAVPRELPHLFWLCREVLARLDPHTPLDAADPWLDALLTPETPQPSGRCLAMFRKRLAGPRGANELAFVRGFVRELDLVEEDPEFSGFHEELFAFYEHPRLYRACVLPAWPRTWPALWPGPAPCVPLRRRCCACPSSSRQGRREGSVPA